mmetsp:Transcript_773/g.1819  ORF Transcript_773/g.1819 Transcript_773/m.1819 type:complete len:93 (+) Transcript_773:498-776(+)
MKLLREKWGLNAEVVAEMKFDIPNMYKFHKQKCVDVEVDLLRIFWDEEEEEGNGKGVDGVNANNRVDRSSHHEVEEEESEGEEMPLGLCGHA